MIKYFILLFLIFIFSFSTTADEKEITEDQIKAWWKENTFQVIEGGSIPSNHSAVSEFGCKPKKTKSLLSGYVVIKNTAKEPMDFSICFSTDDNHQDDISEEIGGTYYNNSLNCFYELDVAPQEVIGKVGDEFMYKICGRMDTGSIQVYSQPAYTAHQLPTEFDDLAWYNEWKRGTLYYLLPGK